MTWRLPSGRTASPVNIAAAPPAPTANPPLARADPERHDDATKMTARGQREVAVQQRALLLEQAGPDRPCWPRADHPDALVTEHQLAGQVGRLVGAAEVAGLQRRACRAKVDDILEVRRTAKLRLPEQGVRVEHPVTMLGARCDVPGRAAKVELPTLRRADEVLRR